MNTQIEIKTAAEYRAEAAASLQEREDSFQRCDTDGFLTQWSCGLNADLARTRANIVEAGNTAIFLGLYDGEHRVRAREVFTQYGTYCWLLDDEEAARYGRKFLPMGENSRVQKKLGLREANESAPAWAKLDGHGTGLSGNAWVATFRTGDKWGSDAQLVK